MHGATARQPPSAVRRGARAGPGLRACAAAAPTMSAAKENPCRKFQANIFNKSKCQNCFKPRESHLLNDEDLTQVSGRGSRGRLGGETRVPRGAAPDPRRPPRAGSLPARSRPARCCKPSSEAGESAWPGALAASPQS